MEKIYDTNDREAWAIRLERPYNFGSPFGGQEFALLLLVDDTSVNPEERVILSTQFVEHGCRYAVCAGHRCSLWDDSIDWAHLDTDPKFDPPACENVMTSWHDGESIEEVAEFFAFWSRFDGFESARLLVAYVGGEAAAFADVCDAVRTQLGLSST